MPLLSLLFLLLVLLPAHVLSITKHVPATKESLHEGREWWHLGLLLLVLLLLVLVYAFHPAVWSCACAMVV